VRPGGPGEVGEAQAQHHGAAEPVAAAQPAGQPVDRAGEDGVELLGRPGPAAEGLLGADRAAPPAGVHRSRVAVVGERVQVAPAGPAEQRDQQRFAQRGDLADRADPHAVQGGCGDPADPPEPLDGQRVQEGQLALRRDQQQPVGLGDPAGHLGQELGARDAHRDGQPDLLEHVAAQRRGDVVRGPGDPPQPAHVEERLVDRDALDQRRRGAEDLEHRLARIRVGAHPRRHDDRLRAELARLPSAHRGAHAAGLRLVGRREDHAPADDDRPAAQAHVVALLDRRVESVQVGVQDRGAARHEHMFASRAAVVRCGAPNGAPRRRRHALTCMLNGNRVTRQVRAPTKSPCGRRSGGAARG
jgi:hypothetical protein